MTDPTTPAARPLPADVAGLVERILSMPHRMDCGLLGGYDGGCTCGHDQAVADAEAQARQIADLTAENARLREALVNTAASLAAAISLLERGGKAAKKAAPSDKMFDLMLTDYRKALSDARAAMKGGDNG